MGEATSDNCPTHQVLKRHLEVGVWGHVVELEEGDLARRLKDAEEFPADVSRQVVSVTLEECCLVNPQDTVQCSSSVDDVLQSTARKPQTQLWSSWRDAKSKVDRG